VYISTGGAVKLLDFNPVGSSTQPLLFTWDELYPASAHGSRCTCDQGAARGTRERGSSSSGGESDADRLHLAYAGLRMVEDAGHLQQGSMAYGAPLDIAGMHGMAWSDVIDHMRAQ